MKFLILLLVLSSFADRRLDYIGKHPELTRSVIEAVQRGELVKGMPESAVIVVKGQPLERAVIQDYQGYDIIIFGYRDQYLFLVQEGRSLVLIDWRKR